MLPESNEIRIEPVNRCNYSCVMCKIEDVTRPRRTMTFSECKALLDKIRGETNQYNVLAWAGIGEPLLCRDLERMTEYAAGLGFRVLLVTNGALLYPQKFLDLQNAGLYSVRVSFHGANPVEYGRLHGKDIAQFGRTLENVYAASDNRDGCKLLLTWAQVSGVNDGDTERWKEMFAGRVDLMEIWRAHNWAGAFSFRKEQDRKLRTCGRCHRGPLQVQVDGTLTACCFDWDGELTFGDLAQQGLHEAFNGQLFRAIKHHHETGDFRGTNLICEHCDQRNADKSDVLIYTSEGIDHSERVRLTSTAYTKTDVSEAE